MEIDLFTPEIVNGMTQRQVTIRKQLSNGNWQQVVATVWITPDDSGKTMANSSRTGSIDFLERALEALRRA